MLIFSLGLLLFLYLLLKIIRCILIIIVYKFGKFSYDGFQALGFSYNSKKDIFYSIKNAWQKKFGYTHIYDVGAPLFSIIIDTEPIKFYYNNKNWLITFWKGQYGMATGAEIGIYYTEEKRINKHTIYKPAEPEYWLDMCFLLYKNNKLIARINSKTWWLTAFKLGMFSNPNELSMDINITFKNREMLEAFLSSFRKHKHKKENYKAIDKTFCFLYKKPRTPKVWTRTWLTDTFTQWMNHKKIKIYNKYLADLIETNNIDESNHPKQKQININDLIPKILKNKEESIHHRKHREKDHE